MKKGVLEIVAYALLILGGLNLGLVGVGLPNLIERFLPFPYIIPALYVLIGLSAIYSIYSLFKNN